MGRRTLRRSFKSPATRRDEIACNMDGAQINFTWYAVA